jgi:hypothetical protein
MYWRFSPKLQDEVMGQWYTELKNLFVKEPPSPDTLTLALDLFNDTYSKVKRYDEGNFYTLISMAVKAARMFKVEAV